MMNEREMAKSSRLAVGRQPILSPGYRILSVRSAFPLVLKSEDASVNAARTGSDAAGNEADADADADADLGQHDLGL